MREARSTSTKQKEYKEEFWIISGFTDLDGKKREKDCVICGRGTKSVGHLVEQWEHNKQKREEIY